MSANVILLNMVILLAKPEVASLTGSLRRETYSLLHRPGRRMQLHAHHFDVIDAGEVSAQGQQKLRNPQILRRASSGGQGLMIGNRLG
jgi:hypothetical protein